MQIRLKIPAVGNLEIQAGVLWAAVLPQVRPVYPHGLIEENFPARTPPRRSRILRPLLPRRRRIAGNQKSRPPKPDEALQDSWDQGSGTDTQIWTSTQPRARSAAVQSATTSCPSRTFLPGPMPHRADQTIAQTLKS